VKLVASAIVRNEADRYLAVWLDHLLTFCDQVVLLDDASTDATRDIALAYPEAVVLPNTGRAFFEHESDARNLLLRHTLQAGADYVLAIDADEFVGDTLALREAILGDAPVYALWMREVWKDDGDRLGLRVDGLWGDRRCPLLWRVPARSSGQQWRIPRRKLACGREPLAIRRQRGIDTGVGVYHYGWTRESERQVRAARYFEHDRGRYHADRHLQSILWPDDRITLNWVPRPPSIPTAVTSWTPHG
jgi:glycosyltransferase involved in cell wall biosynthesis